MFNKFLESLTADVGGIFYSKLLDGLQNYSNTGDLQSAVFSMFPQSPEQITQEPSEEDFLQLCSGDFGRDTVTLVYLNDLIHKLLTGEISEITPITFPNKKGTLVFERFASIAALINVFLGRVPGLENPLKLNITGGVTSRETLAYVAVISLIQAFFASQGSTKTLFFLHPEELQETRAKLEEDNNLLEIDESILDQINDSLPEGSNDVFATVKYLNNQPSPSQRELVPFKDAVPSLLSSTIGLWQQEVAPSFSNIFQSFSTEERAEYVQRYRTKIIENSENFLNDMFSQLPFVVAPNFRTTFVAICNVLSALLAKKKRFLESLESIKSVLRKKEEVLYLSVPEETATAILQKLQSKELTPSILTLMGEKISTIADDSSALFLKDYYAYWQRKLDVDQELLSIDTEIVIQRNELKESFENTTKEMRQHYSVNTMARLAFSKVVTVFYFIFLNEQIFPGVSIKKSLQRVGIAKLGNLLGKIPLRKGFSRLKKYRAEAEPRESLQESLNGHITRLLKNFKMEGKKNLTNFPITNLPRAKQEIGQLLEGIRNLEPTGKILELYPAFLQDYSGFLEVENVWVTREVLDAFSALLFNLSSRGSVPRHFLTNVQVFITLATADQRNSHLLSIQWKKIEPFVQKFQDASFIESIDIENTLKKQLAINLESRNKEEDRIVVSLEQDPNSKRTKELEEVEGAIIEVKAQIFNDLEGNPELEKRLTKLSWFGIGRLASGELEAVRNIFTGHLNFLIGGLSNQLQAIWKGQGVSTPESTLDLIFGSSSFLRTILSNNGPVQGVLVEWKNPGFSVFGGHSDDTLNRLVLISYMGFFLERKKRQLQDESLFYSVLSPVGTSQAVLGNNQLGLDRLNSITSNLFRELRLGDLSEQTKTKADNNYFDILPIVIGAFVDLSGNQTPPEESREKLRVLGLSSSIQTFDQLFYAYQFLGNKVFDFQSHLQTKLTELTLNNEPQLGFLEAIQKAVIDFCKKSVVGLANSTVKAIGISIAGIVIRGLLFNSVAGSLSPMALALNFLVYKSLQYSGRQSATFFSVSISKLRELWLGTDQVQISRANDAIFDAVLLALQIEQESKPEELGIKFSYDLKTGKILSLLRDFSLSPVVLSDRLPALLEDDPKDTHLSASLLNLYMNLNRQLFEVPIDTLQKVSFLSQTTKSAQKMITKRLSQQNLPGNIKNSIESYFNFCEFLNKNKSKLQILSGLNISSLSSKIQESGGFSLQEFPVEAFRKDLLRTCLDFLVYGLALTKVAAHKSTKSPWEIGLNLKSEQIVGSQLFDASLGVLGLTMKLFVELRKANAGFRVSNEAQDVFDRLQAFVSDCNTLRKEVAGDKAVVGFPSEESIQECYNFLDALEGSEDIGMAFYFPFLLELEKNKSLLFALLSFSLVQEDGFLDKESLMEFFKNGTLVSTTNKTGNIGMLFALPMLKAYSDIAMSPKNSNQNLLKFVGQAIPEEQNQQIVPVGQRQQPGLSASSEILQGRGISRLPSHETWNNPRLQELQRGFPIDIPAEGVPHSGRPLAIEDAPQEYPQLAENQQQQMYPQLPQAQQNAQGDLQEGQRQQQQQQGRPIAAYQGAMQQQEGVDNSLPLVANALNQAQDLVGDPQEQALQQQVQPSVRDQNLIGVDASGRSFGLGANSGNPPQEIPLRARDFGPPAPLGSVGNPGPYYNPVRRSLDVAANPANQPSVDTPFPWGTAAKIGGGVLAGSYILSQLNNKKRRKQEMGEHTKHTNKGYSSEIKIDATGTAWQSRAVSGNMRVYKKPSGSNAWVQVKKYDRAGNSEKTFANKLIDTEIDKVGASEKLKTTTPSGQIKSNQITTQAAFEEQGKILSESKDKNQIGKAIADLAYSRANTERLENPGSRPDPNSDLILWKENWEKNMPSSPEKEMLRAYLVNHPGQTGISNDIFNQAVWTFDSEKNKYSMLDSLSESKEKRGTLLEDLKGDLLETQRTPTTNFMLSDQNSPYKSLWGELPATDNEPSPNDLQQMKSMRDLQFQQRNSFPHGDVLAQSMPKTPPNFQWDKQPTYDNAKSLWDEMQPNYTYDSTKPFDRRTHNLGIAGHGAGSTSIADTESGKQRAMHQEDLQNIQSIHNMLMGEHRAKGDTVGYLDKLAGASRDAYADPIELENNVLGRGFDRANQQDYNKNVLAKDLANAEFGNIQKDLSEDTLQNEILENDRRNKLNESQRATQLVDQLNLMIQTKGIEAAMQDTSYATLLENLNNNREQMIMAMESHGLNMEAGKLKMKKEANRKEWLETLMSLGAQAVGITASALIGKTPSAPKASATEKTPEAATPAIGQSAAAITPTLNWDGHSNYKRRD